MHRFALPCLVLIGLSATAIAQSPMGFMNRTGTSFTSRGSASIPNTNPSVSFLRIDKESYAGWGVNPASPGMREILGITGFIQDQIGNTAETYELVVYTEDAANLNYPLIAAPMGTVGPLPTPPSTAAGAVAFNINITFGTPILTPATGDAFLGVAMPQPATGVWPTDGLSCHALYYVMVTSGFYDLPGASHPVGQPEEGNGGWYVDPLLSGLGPQYTTTPRQWKLEPIIAGAGGVAGTISNQTWATLSNVAPGSSSMSSGLHPDAQNPPLNIGRVDDIASRWFMTGAPDGSAVFFLASFNTFGPEIPLSAFLGGSSGMVCIDTTVNIQLGLTFTTAGEAFLPLAIPLAARSLIAGVDLVHQSVGLIGNVGHANPCTHQIL